MARTQLHDLPEENLSEMEMRLLVGGGYSFSLGFGISTSPLVGGFGGSFPGSGFGACSFGSHAFGGGSGGSSGSGGDSGGPGSTTRRGGCRS